jgi:hypothetical protein
MEIIDRLCTGMKSNGELEKEILTLLSQVKNKVKAHNRIIQAQIYHMLQGVMYDSDDVQYKLSAATIRGLSCRFRDYLKDSRKKVYELLSEKSYEHLISEDNTDEFPILVRELDDKIDDVFNDYDPVNFALKSEQGIESLLERIELFGAEIIGFSSYDSESCIRLLGKSLIHVGKNIKENGMCVNSEKNGVSAIKAGGMLINAYEGVDSESTAAKHFRKSLNNLHDKRYEFIHNVRCWGNDERNDYWDLRKTFDKAKTTLYNEERDKKVSAWNNITRLVGKDKFGLAPAIDKWWS